jgi:peptidoglycan/xylan/chitin deacetylase (PgdA/CDA1 family)
VLSDRDNTIVAGRLLQYDPVISRMRFVSPLLKHAVYPALHRAGYFGRADSTSGCAVVNYHGLIPADHAVDEKFLDGNLVSAEVFRTQLQYLKAHYRIVHPEDFRVSIERGPSLPRRSVLVTCDDGLLNTLTDMLPILQNESVPCLFFVTAQSCGDDGGMLWYEELYRLMRNAPLGELTSGLPMDDAAQTNSTGTFQSNWWSMVQGASRLDAAARAEWMAVVRARGGVAPAGSGKRWNLLNVSELKQLSEAGMTIGAHTRTHPILSQCTEREAAREITASKLALERALGREVWAFAYPFGNPATMGEREFRLAEAAGFTCAFLNVEHWAGVHSSPFALPRTHVTSDTTLPELAAHLSGFHSRLQRAMGS